MTIDEFIRRLEQTSGWRVTDDLQKSLLAGWTEHGGGVRYHDLLRNESGMCPLMAVAGQTISAKDAGAFLRLEPDDINQIVLGADCRNGVLRQRILDATINKPRVAMFGTV